MDGGQAPDFATRINFIEVDARAEPEGCDEVTEEDEDEREEGGTTMTAMSPNMPASRLASASPISPININFQFAGSQKACGYEPDRGRLIGKRFDMAFGWNLDHTKRARDRGVRLDQRKDTFIRFLAGGVWEIAVPKGDHRAKIAVGDTNLPSVNTINVEGVNFFDDLALGGQRVRDGHPHGPRAGWAIDDRHRKVVHQQDKDQLRRHQFTRCAGM